MNNTSVTLTGVLGTGNGRAPRAALRRMYQEQREVCAAVTVTLYSVLSLCNALQWQAERGNGNGNPGKRREQASIFKAPSLPDSAANCSPKDHRRQRGWQSK